MNIKNRSGLRQSFSKRLQSCSSSAVALGWKILALPYELAVLRQADQDLPVLPTVFANTYNIVLPDEEPLTRPDYYLGYGFTSGREFIGRKNFVSITTVIEIALSSQRRLILNVGDSSTSGWDSHVVTRNRNLLLEGGQALEIPFFKYSTYSDILAERFRESRQFIVVNAGIPGYTSIQGKRHLLELLIIFRSLEIKIAAVTMYFGNNDCMWNSNYEDVNILPSTDDTWTNECLYKIFNSSPAGRNWITKRQSQKRLPPSDTIRTRVSLSDYLNAISDICALTINSGATPIVIIPPIPLRWRPGDRVEGESLGQPWLAEQSGGKLVLQNLDLAKLYWEKALESTNEARIQKLVEAAEHDFVLPRIKHQYSTSLLRLCRENNFPAVYIKADRNISETDLFLDYCHPIGDINREIADQILTYIDLDKKIDYAPGNAMHRQSAIVRKAAIKADNYKKAHDLGRIKHSSVYPLY